MAFNVVTSVNECVQTDARFMAGYYCQLEPVRVMGRDLFRAVELILSMRATQLNHGLQVQNSPRWVSYESGASYHVTSGFALNIGHRFSD